MLVLSKSLICVELLDKNRMLTEEQASQIKRQIIDNINSTYPGDKKASAIQLLESMNHEQLEQFILDNKMIKNVNPNQQCVFCSIISGDISGIKIAENQHATAFLEINPISQGHSIIIPKTHAEKCPKGAYSLAEDISKKLNHVFSPKNIEIVPSNMFGHEILNVIPVYENETLQSPRHSATHEDLEKVREQLSRVIDSPTQKSSPKKETKPKKPKPLTEKNTWLPKRFP